MADELVKQKFRSRLASLDKKLRRFSRALSWAVGPALQELVLFYYFCWRAPSIRIVFLRLADPPLTFLCNGHCLLAG